MTVTGTHPIHTHAYRARHMESEHLWPQAAQEVLAAGSQARGTFAVTGGPGAGRTTFAQDIVISQCRAGVAPDSILVLAPSKPAAGRMNRAILSALSHPDNSGHSDISAHSGRPEAADSSADSDEGTVEKKGLIFTEPIVRSVHSFAYAVLRARALAAHQQAPRLLTGAEHDAGVRDLLMGHAERGGQAWPERFRPALPTVGLARQLRDLLLRSAERGLQPADLTALGAQYGRDEWEAAGKFWAEYEQVMALRGAENLNASELVSAAVRCLETDSTLRDRLSYEVVVVDDAHILDPKSAELVDILRTQARLTVVTADENQAVFHFRGASAAYARALASQEQEIHLPGTHRMPPELAVPAAGVARATGSAAGAQWEQEIREALDKLSELDETGKAGKTGKTGKTGRAQAADDRVEGENPEQQDGTSGGCPVAENQEESAEVSATSAEEESPEEEAGWGDTGGVAVHVVTTPTAEIAAVVDRVRRAHLGDGVEWRDIAVIVRSTRMAGPLRRGLLSAGVPVADDPTDIVLSEQPMVQSLLQTIHCASGAFISDSELERMILSPIGGGDPITYRRLIRGLRRGYMKLEVDDPARAAEITELVTAGATGAKGSKGLKVPGGPESPVNSGESEGTAGTAGAEETENGVFTALAALRFILFGGELEELLVYLTSRERDFIDRIRSVVGAARKALAAQATVETVLWEVWDAAGLEQSLAQKSLRGGAAGSMADRHLDAVMSLFDAAGDYVERHPHATISTFIQFIEEQQLPTGARDRRGPARNAVEVLPAHGAVGREWDTVIVSGLQEGVWPSQGQTGGIFHQEELLDLLDRSIEPGQPGAREGRLVDSLREERRLFLLALTRARRSLLVTAVGPMQPENGGDDPASDERSRFLAEMGVDVQPTGQPASPGDDGQTLRHNASGSQNGETAQPSSWLDLWAHPGVPRVLSRSSFVAELRRTVCDPDAPSADREQAAWQLARLAQEADQSSHRLASAKPEYWWGERSVSSDEPVHEPGTAVFLSPSRVESALACALRDLFRQAQGQSETTSAMAMGTLFHACAQALAEGVDYEDVAAVLAKNLPRLLDSYPWQLEADKEDWLAALAALRSFLDQNSAEGRTLIGTEVGVRQQIGETAAGHHVFIGGRIDRLEEDAEHNRHVIDFKTSKNAITVGAAAENPQLRTYQAVLAVESTRGAVLSTPENGADTVFTVEGAENAAADATATTGARPVDIQIAGAELVYPRDRTAKGEPNVRRQEVMTPQETRDWTQALCELAERLSGSTFVATPSSSTCRSCEFSSLCPAQGDQQSTIESGGLL